MPVESIKPAEGVIRSQLKSLGYSNIEIRDEQEHSFKVIAEGTLRSILLLVIVYLVTEKLKELTNEQISEVKKNASTIKKEPWAAFMKVNEKGELIDNIQWTNLSKLTMAR